MDNIQGYTLKDGTKLQCLYEEEKGEKTSYFYDGKFCYIVSSFDCFKGYYCEATDTFYGYDLSVLPGSTFIEKVVSISEIGLNGTFLPIKTSIRDFIFRHYYKNFKKFDPVGNAYNFKKKYLKD